MTLHTPSEEQQKVIDNAFNYNLVVNAVAGAGKTTTNLHIAKNYPKKQILLLTYNRRLKEETEKRVKQYKINNLHVYTYHGFCHNVLRKKYNHNAVSDDVKMYQLIKKIKKIDEYKYYSSDESIVKDEPKLASKCTSSNQLPEYFDLVIADEAQDLTKLYVDLINIICEKLTNDGAKLSLLGDTRQCIYGFKGASAIYMETPKKYFEKINGDWKRKYMNTSFRITKQIANFVNFCSEDEINQRPGCKMIATKNGPNIEYIITPKCDKYPAYYENTLIEIEKKITELLENYEPEDIFILAPSVSTQGLGNKIANVLSKSIPKKKIYSYVANTNIGDRDKKETQNKLIISTIHQAKGLERKVVLLLNFDQSYYKYYGRDSMFNTNCINVMYVALTRASERLILFHDAKFNYLNFIKNITMPEYVDRIGNQVINNAEMASEKPLNKLDVSKLCKFINYLTIIDFMKCIETQTLLEPTNKLMHKIHVKTEYNKKSYYENVSAIIGIAIPAYYEYQKKGTFEVLQCLQRINTSTSKKDSIKYYSSRLEVNKYIDNPSLNSLTPEILFKICTIYYVIINEEYYKINQIGKSYKWVNQATLDTIYINITKMFNKVNEDMGKNKCNNMIDDNARFEYLQIYSKEKLKNKYKLSLSDNISNEFKLRSRVDLYIFGEHKSLYEFKVVSDLNDDHVIQAAIYSFLHKIPCYLYNIKRHHLLKISTKQGFSKIFTKIINNKFPDKKHINDLSS